MNVKNLTASDQMSGSAKHAIDTALGDAKTQLVGGARPAAAYGSSGSPAASPAPGQAAPKE